MKFEKEIKQVPLLIFTGSKDLNPYTVKDILYERYANKRITEFAENDKIDKVIIHTHPESGNHPKRIREIASSYAKFVQEKKYEQIIVLTYSSLLLEQLANHIRLSKLSTERKEKFANIDSFLRIEYPIREEDVAVYQIFSEEKIQEISPDDDGEFDVTDFDIEHSDIYNQSARLQDCVEKNK